MSDVLTTGPWWVLEELNHKVQPGETWHRESNGRIHLRSSITGVSFLVGCILLTNSQLCKYAILRRMPYFLESSDYSGVLLLNMESFNITSISAISSRKAISRHHEDFVQFTAQRSWFLTCRPDGPKEPPRCPSVFEECPNTSVDTNHRELTFALMSRQLSDQQLLRALICIGVRMAN